MKPPTPAGSAAGRIAVRKVMMPSGGRPFTDRRSWQARPGETFATGGTLVELTLTPPPAATFAAGFVSLVNISLKRHQEAFLVKAPEDGVLTWHVPDGGDIRTGEPIAAYIPLAAWQPYERLLAEHERQFRERIAEPPAAAPAAAAGSLSGKLDAMIAWANAISARAIRADKSAMIPLLVKQMENTISAAYPASAEDLAPLYHRYFRLIQSIDERFLALDARYAAIWHDPALAPDDAAELIRSWLENKETVIRQITGDQTRGNEGGGGQQ